MDDNLDRTGEQVTVDLFGKIDIRVGRILKCEPFPEARKPSYRLVVDFGPLGVKQSSAQLTTYYAPDELLGKLVVAVVNFPPRRIAGFASEVLILGVPGEWIARHGPVALLVPDRNVALGARVF